MSASVSKLMSWMFGDMGVSSAQMALLFRAAIERLFKVLKQG